ncbi:hypothetical protein [Streptomyces sp. 7N604]|uniref:hypothetical protein n=1 Tax=Streptomyces sp. 7N604 TaxID=3457415 RepID=UPI003FD388CE
MSDQTDQATALSPERIAELHERARREAGPFVHARVLETPVHNAEWAAAVLGRPYHGPRTVTWPERYLLYLAALAEPTPPPPPKATAALVRYRAEEEARRKAAEEQHRRRVQEWEELAAALHDATGVRFEVRHNYTSHRHLDGYTQGGDHIYLLDDLDVGRLHRKAHHVLCWVPSRAHDLEVFEFLDDGRLPNCKACLRIARRLST